MTITMAAMQSLEGRMFVLWGNHFDALMAITFVSCLRQSGIGTKIVGIHGRTAVGHQGVTLTADVTLGEAMASCFAIDYIIVPCHSPHFGSLHNDPRISTLLTAAHQNGTRFISGLLSAVDASLFPVPIHRIESYVEPHEYTERVKKIIQE